MFYVKDNSHLDRYIDPFYRKTLVISAKNQIQVDCAQLVKFNSHNV